MLALIGTLALSATVAQAGSGGRPSALTSFFACYTIDGHDSGQVVDVDVTEQSPIASPDRIGVRVGAGTLACGLIKLFVRQPNVTDPVLVEPDPNAVDENTSSGFNAIKCYSVTTPKGTSFPGPSGAVSIIDALFGHLGTLTGTATEGTLGEEKPVNFSQFKYICGPAKFGTPS
jgi:hypothetical protein